MLLDAADVAAMAHGDIAIIAAQNHLRTLGDDVAAGNTGVDGSFTAAVAHGFDLFDAICQLHQPHRAGEQLGLEVCPQAEAHHRHIKIVDDVTELIDLLREDCRLPLEKLAVILGSTTTEVAETIDRLEEEIMLLDEAGDNFDLEKVRKGELTPMFFGSAFNNFAYHLLLRKDESSLWS